MSTDSTPTSQFTGKKRVHPSKLRRKRFTVVELPPRKAKGSARNFQKRQAADRGFLRGDRIVTTEEAIWLQVKTR